MVFETDEEAPAADLAEDPENEGLNGGVKLQAARLIMRAAATHKVVLNARIFKEMSIGDAGGNEPKGKSLMFSVPVDGKLIPHTLKVRLFLSRYQPKLTRIRWAKMAQRKNCIDMSNNYRLRCKKTKFRAV